jgi:ATP-dependent helicase Lhr and Lhr-like helicase
VLPSRVAGYRSAWLDELCMSGEVAWARLRVRDDPGAGSPPRSSSSASRATPVTLLMRSDLPWLLQSVRGEAQPLEPISGATLDVLDALREHGALFTSDIVTLARRLPSEVEAALWDGVSRGLLTADGFSAVRRLLVSRRLGSRPHHRGLRHGVSGYSSGEGRWSLIPRVASVAEHDALAEAIAEQLLVRWGVVFRDVVARETIALPWRDVVWALRRMEARGTARGGRFVTGFAGEQFALPEAVDQLRSVRRRERSSEVVRVSATDPLNVAGILLPGPRITSVRTNTVVFEDGVPVTSVDTAFAAVASH